MSTGRDTSARLLCSFCGDVIGIYEPLILVSGADARQTSLAAEPDIQADDVNTYHRSCLTSESVDTAR